MRGLLSQSQKAPQRRFGKEIDDAILLNKGFFLLRVIESGNERVIIYKFGHNIVRVLLRTTAAAAL